MSDELLRAVLDAPDDDAPRLVYADWLRERGQPERADLIALQCAGREPERVRQLLERHGRDWEAELGPGVSRVRFVRGFADTAYLELTGPDPLGLLDQAPLRWLEISADEGMVETIAGDPRLDRLRGLHLGGGSWGAGDVFALLSRGRWSELRHLSADDARCTPELAQALNAPGLALQLEVLELYGDCEGNLGPGGLALLMESPALAGLRSLRLLNLALGPEDARALAARAPATLRRLDLGGGSYEPNRIGPEGASALAASPPLSSLVDLCLDFNLVGDAGLAALARSSTLNTLLHLSLKGNDLGDQGLIALALGEGLLALTHLELTWNRALGAEGFRALVSSPRFASIESLWIRQCPLGPAAGHALASSPHAANLRDLNLLECELGPEGALALASSPYLENLQKLQLSGNRLDEATRQRLHERFGDRVEYAR